MSVPNQKDMLNPLLSTLKKMGSSARPNEVYTKIAKALKLTKELKICAFQTP